MQQVCIRFSLHTIQRIVRPEPGLPTLAAINALGGQEARRLGGCVVPYFSLQNLAGCYGCAANEPSEPWDWLRRWNGWKSSIRLRYPH